MWKFLNTALKSMALEISHKSISQLTNSSPLLSSRNKRNRTKTVATTCFLDCLTLMMKALCYFKTQVSLYHRYSQHPKIPEFSAYVLLPCIPIFSSVIFIFAYFVRLSFTHSHKMTEFLFYFTVYTQLVNHTLHCLQKDGHIWHEFDIPRTESNVV